MLESLVQSLQQHAQAFSWLAYPLVFAGGALTGLNPCVLPTIPVVLGYIGGHGGQSKVRGLLLALSFVLGLAIVYTVLGAAASFFGNILGLPRFAWLFIAAVVCLAVGANLAGLYSLKFGALAPLQSRWSEQSTFLGALALGMLFGLVATPCATPVLALVVALVASKGAVAYGASLLFVYALGHGLPLVVLGAITGALTSLERLSKYTPSVQKGAGWLLILAGIYLAGYATRMMLK
jgi:cytochrome c-type biogenesis protein